VTQHIGGLAVLANKEMRPMKEKCFSVSSSRPPSRQRLAMA